MHINHALKTKHAKYKIHTKKQHKHTLFRKYIKNKKYYKNITAKKQFSPFCWILTNNE